MAKKNIFLSLVILAVAALGATASAQSSDPKMGGGVSPAETTVISTMMFTATLWSRDFDTGVAGVCCNNLTTVVIKRLESGTTLQFAHTSFDDSTCTHTFTHKVKARAVSETHVYLDVYTVKDLSPYLRDPDFDVAMIVTVTPPPPPPSRQTD
jgi:hypothetical protein